MDSAARVVKTLLDDESQETEAPQLHYRDNGNPCMAVKVRMANGSVVDAEFNGWYDLTVAGKGFLPSVSFNGSHGILRREVGTLLTPVPSPDEWTRLQDPVRHREFEKFKEVTFGRP